VFGNDAKNKKEKITMITFMFWLAIVASIGGVILTAFCIWNEYWVLVFWNIIWIGMNVANAIRFGRLKFIQGK
jgi:hypothetical protein